MTRALRIVLALALLLGFARAGQFWSHRQVEGIEAPVLLDALGEPVERVSPALLDAGAGVGLLLLGAWLVGQLLAPTGLPKMMGFLGFGLLCGPSLLGVVSESELGYLVLVNDLAIALIALLAGAEIKIEFLRKSIRAVSLVSLIEMGAVWIGVTGAAFLIVPRLGMVEGALPVFLVSLIVGTVLITNSPAVLLALITELQAKGLMTRTSLAVTVCKDLLLVVLFTVVLAVAGGMLGQRQEGVGVVGAEDSVLMVEGLDLEGDGGGAGEALGEKIEAGEGQEGPGMGMWVSLIQHLVGSIAAGVIVGLAMAWYLHRIDAHLPVFLVFVCFGIALVSEALHLETLIVAVTAGMLMENVWGERLEGFFETVEETSTPVFCVFFAVTGAKIDLGQVFGLWHWALALVAARMLIVWASTTGAARVAGLEGRAGRWLWTAFVPQAGISLALALIVEETLGDLGLEFADDLFTLLIGVITINLLVGPLVVSLGLRRSGEAWAMDGSESGAPGEGEGGVDS